MNTETTVLLDLIAALSHDLRSTLSSASLAAGLMSTHADEEVQGFAARLNRTVQTQTALLDLAAGLVESLEGESQDLTMREFAACLEEHGVDVHGPRYDQPISKGRVIAAALARLLNKGAVRMTLNDDTVSLTTEAEHEAPGSRSTAYVILVACGVRTELHDAGLRFILEA